MENETLYHYGVLGMKWGVRRTPAQLARAAKERLGSRKSKKESSNDSGNSNQSKKKSVSEMSNDELRKYVERRRLEEDYKRYASANEKKVSLGKKVTSKIINDVVVPSAISSSKTVLNEYLTKAGKDYLGLGKKTNELDLLKEEVNKLALQKQKIDLTRYLEKELK